MNKQTEDEKEDFGFQSMYYNEIQMPKSISLITLLRVSHRLRQMGYQMKAGNCAGNVTKV